MVTGPRPSPADDDGERLMGRIVSERGARRERWVLVRADGRALGPVEVANTTVSRAVGLLGRRSLAGAVLLDPCRSVHTIGMMMAIDVAFLDRDLRVLEIITLPPARATRPRRRARAVLETEAGRLSTWGLSAGTTLEIRRADPDA